MKNSLSILTLVVLALVTPACGQVAAAGSAVQNAADVKTCCPIIGAMVQRPNGDYLGTIRDLVVDPATGQSVYVVLGFDNPFAYDKAAMILPGEKRVAVPWSRLTPVAGQNSFSLEIDSSTLIQAPAFEPSQTLDTPTDASIRQFWAGH
jgi:sporulation protein YlmC with PRC-barrel domain